MRPYYLQSFRFLPYLGKKRYAWPKGVETELYLSFEDALWDLLPRLGVRRGAMILVPRFYCKDVIENMIAHGYKVSIYPVNEDLTYSVKRIMEVVSAEQPDVFIDFQYTGINTALLSDIERKLDFRTLLISDCVHEIVYPHVDYFPHSDRHLILSSYRKVTAFPGSLAVYTRNARVSQNRFPLWYTIKVLLKWFWVIVLLKSSYFFSSQTVGKWAESAMQNHNDLVGDSLESKALPNWLKTIYEYIAVEKIHARKVAQCKLYAENFKYIKSNNYELFHMDDADYGKLQGYPVLIKHSKYQRFLSIARIFGLLRHYQIEDITNVELTEKIILLPLGPHLTDNDIITIVKRVNKALTALT